VCERELRMCVMCGYQQARGGVMGCQSATQTGMVNWEKGNKQNGIVIIK
jgi:hypothetical protein